MKFVFKQQEIKVSEVPADKVGLFRGYIKNNEGKELSASEYTYTNPTPKFRSTLLSLASNYHISVEGSIDPLERVFAKIQQQEEKIKSLEKQNAIADKELQDLNNILNFN